MKKRLLSLALVTLLLIGAAGCRTAGKTQESAAPVSNSPQDIAPPPVDAGVEETTALAAYTRVADKLTISGEAGEDVQFDMDMIMKINIESDGESESLEVNGNIKVKIDGEETHSSIVMDMGVMGRMEMYSDGERVYCSMNGQEMEIETGNVMEQIQGSLNLPQFEEDAIKSCEITEDGENTKMLIVIDGETLTSFVAESMSAMLGEVADSQGMEIYDIEITLVTTKDEIPLSMEMKMEMDMTVMENTMKMVTEITYIFNKVGSGVEVDLSKL